MEMIIRLGENDLELTEKVDCWEAVIHCSDLADKIYEQHRSVIAPVVKYKFEDLNKSSLLYVVVDSNKVVEVNLNVWECEHEVVKLPAMRIE